MSAVPSKVEFVARALDFLRDVLGDAAASLDADTDLYTSDQFDSLALVAFLGFVEDELARPIDLDDIDPSQFTTIGDSYEILVRVSARG